MSGGLGSREPDARLVSEIRASTGIKIVPLPHTWA